MPAEVETLVRRHLVRPVRIEVGVSAKPVAKVTQRLYQAPTHDKTPLLLKLLVSRAISDPVVKAHCEAVAGEPIEVSDVIAGTDAQVQKIFYTIFEPTLNTTGGSPEDAIPFTHVWIMRHLTDGAGNIYPREVIHLGNMAVEKQREMNRAANKHCSTKLISGKALDLMISATRTEARDEAGEFGLHGGDFARVEEMGQNDVTVSLELPELVRIEFHGVETHFTKSSGESRR